MATLNKARKTTAARTFEGAPAVRSNAEDLLRRSVMACLLWEDSFYEDGESIANRIANTIPRVDPAVVATMAVEARTEMKLRHVPLLMARCMLASPKHRMFVSKVLENIIQRPDELTEFLAVYWKDGRKPIAAQVKKGLGRAFTKFNEYSLAKYNRDGAVKLRDVLFLCHPKPQDKKQERLWKKLVDGKLKTPDTWEVGLSAGKDKKETWTRLMSEGQLGGLALLRNLRNMTQVGVSEALIKKSLVAMKTERILPFRFIAAAKYAPHLEDVIEVPMLKCLNGMDKLPGKTALLVDVSGSMEWDNISKKSELNRLQAACGLAILARELCEEIDIYTFSNSVVRVAPRHGFALRDTINNSQEHSGTYLGRAVSVVKGKGYDRVIVLTDEQSADRVNAPDCKGYMINVASYEHAIGYGAWTRITGWSEAVLEYIRAFEEANNAQSGKKTGRGRTGTSVRRNGRSRQ